MNIKGKEVNQTLLLYACYEDTLTFVLPDNLVSDFKTFYSFTDRNYRSLVMELKLSEIVYISSIDDVADFIESEGEEFYYLDSGNSPKEEIDEFIKVTKKLCKHYNIESFYFDDVDIMKGCE